MYIIYIHIQIIYYTYEESDGVWLLFGSDFRNMMEYWWWHATWSHKLWMVQNFRHKKPPHLSRQETSPAASAIPNFGGAEKMIHTSFSSFHWIGLLGKILTGNPGFYHQIGWAFRLKFSHPILWSFFMGKSTINGHFPLLC